MTARKRLVELVAGILGRLVEQVRPGRRPRPANRPEARTLPDLIAETAAAVARAEHQTAQLVRWEINRAANDARIDEARRLAEATGRRLRKVWVAERDACVHCLGLAGRVADLDAGFPPSATFDPRGAPPVFGDDLDAPPRHPNCRCQVTAVPEDDGGFAAGLRREAERSVANGYALDSEPEAVRLRAAEALISRPNRLPRTVVERARRSVAAGSIRRSFPG